MRTGGKLQKPGHYCALSAAVLTCQNRDEDEEVLPHAEVRERRARRGLRLGLLFGGLQLHREGVRRGPVPGHRGGAHRGRQGDTSVGLCALTTLYRCHAKCFMLRVRWLISATGPTPPPLSNCRNGPVTLSFVKLLPFITSLKWLWNQPKLFYRAIRVGYLTHTHTHTHKVLQLAQHQCLKC